MVKELSEEYFSGFLGDCIHDWREYFYLKLSGFDLVSLGFKGEDKNLQALNDIESFRAWYGSKPEVPEPYRDDGFYVQELTFISEFIKPKNIVEFGTSLGIGLVLLYMLNRGSSIVSVDDKDFRYMPGNLQVPTGYIASLNNIKYESIRGKSWETKLGENFDLCFIDADHSGDSVWKDSLWAWENKSDRYSIIWHDYRIGNKEFEGLISSIDRFSEYINRDLYRLKGSSTVWILSL